MELHSVASLVLMTNIFILMVVAYQIATARCLLKVMELRDIVVHHVVFPPIFIIGMELAVGIAILHLLSRLLDLRNGVYLVV